MSAKPNRSAYRRTIARLERVEVDSRFDAVAHRAARDERFSLIAAAPDGLEFAREFDEACTIKAGQSTKAVLGITELNRLWDMARAFIAKAEGREP